MTSRDHTGPDSAIRRVAPDRDHLTIGLELPLDNDWSPAGQDFRQTDGRQPGEPDMSAHLSRAVLADERGFVALWLRDVPVYDPNFGDAGQVFDPFPYLGFLAAATSRLVLGTAAVALPLRHPLHVAKMTATIDRLSEGRLVLGIASGDRPVEFPLFGVDVSRRGEILRENLDVMRSAWATAREPGHGTRLLPAPTGLTVPTVIAGRGGQELRWIAANLDGWFTYHRPPTEMAPVAAEWHTAVPEGTFKPLMTTMLVDLTADPDEPVRPIRFGARLGRHALAEYLRGLRSAGVNHVAINLRPSRRPVEAVLDELAGHVLPEFHAATGRHVPTLAT